MSSYQKMLNKLIDEIFEAWNGSWPELAKEAGLSLATVYRLGNYETGSPHLRTIWKLAKATQIKIVIDFHKKTIRREAA